MDNSRKIVFFEKYLSAFVFFLVFIAYIPSLFNGFVDWDDAPLIIFNNEFRGLGIKQIRWMFSTFHMSHYQPLSWLSLAADYCLWGLNPFGYHITNVILHSFSAALTARLSFIFFRKAGLHTEEALSGAAIAALFWALHPLDSVRIDGILREDKQRMLDILTKSICHVDENAINRTSRVGTL